MDAKLSSPFWWLKKNKSVEENTKFAENDSEASPRLDVDISSSLAEFLEKERAMENGNESEADIGSIIDEINRLAAQSPMGPYEKAVEERSIEDIMKEAERIYLESSRSFEQLSSRSKTSNNLTDMLTSHHSEHSSPSPKSSSPLPLDYELGLKIDEHELENDSYSDDFVEDNKSDVQINSSVPSQKIPETFNTTTIHEIRPTTPIIPLKSNIESEAKETQDYTPVNDVEYQFRNHSDETIQGDDSTPVNNFKFSLIRDKVKLMEDDALQHKDDKELDIKEKLIRKLSNENRSLKEDIGEIKAQLRETTMLLEKSENALRSQLLKSPEVNIELDKAIEELKDTKEMNTALQLQLDAINKTHQHLKGSYEDLLNSNKNLERRLAESESSFISYKNELVAVQQQKEKLAENENNLNKLLDIEKLQNKTVKLQNEKDARCIQDLNRQIKEMERIIARKHPDSVSALIVAAKNDHTETNLTARKVLEDRIKTLENEVSVRDVQSSKIFLEVQDKFNLMKNKYESHIEDLELHVKDLKNQLKHKADTFDVYTQTYLDEQKIPEKESTTVGIQTDGSLNKPLVSKTGTNRQKTADAKEDTHLIATIRGLQTDLINKEKVTIKLQKEIDELRKTNRRLQKEREGSLKNIAEKREFRSYPEKLAQQTKAQSSCDAEKLEEELSEIRSDRDKMRVQLCRMEEDYQTLKTKRLQDLNALQEAHEREVSTYVTNISPLREQLEVQQVTIATLQAQLGSTKEELAIVTVERDHLNNRLNCANALETYKTNINGNGNGDDKELGPLHKKIAYLEKRYEEREHRLRAIVHGLAQKNVTNRSCEQCSARQQQLIAYKTELDQLMATLRALT